MHFRDVHCELDEISGGVNDDEERNANCLRVNFRLGACPAKVGTGFAKGHANKDRERDENSKKAIPLWTGDEQK